MRGMNGRRTSWGRSRSRSSSTWAAADGRLLEPAAELQLVVAIGGGGTAPRSPFSKANLAAPYQAAVVELASYGSGPARAAALLDFGAIKGELSPERPERDHHLRRPRSGRRRSLVGGSNLIPLDDILSFNSDRWPDDAGGGADRASEGPQRPRLCIEHRDRSTAASAPWLSLRPALSATTKAG